MLRFRIADMRYSRFPWVLVAMRLQKIQGQLMAAFLNPSSRLQLANKMSSDYLTLFLNNRAIGGK